MNQQTDHPRRIPLKLAIGDYDHIRDLASGVIKPDGIELTCVVFDQPEEIFYRFLRSREWEISELSLAVYAALISRGARDLTAIPVFPARSFRHSAIYVRGDAPFATLKDLAGRRVGVPVWVQTAGIYVRGILVHEHDVALGDIEWHQAGVNQPGRVEPVDIELPQGVAVARHPKCTLDEMLLTGELDAVISARPPRSFERRDGTVRRMIEDFIGVETEHYHQTKIFPIMHVIVLRRDALETHPWMARSLLTAFEEAKHRSLRRALESTVPHYPLPWTSEHARRAQLLLGEDFWPYGIDGNRSALDAFLNYSLEQGVCTRGLTIEELFPIEVGTAVGLD